MSLVLGMLTVLYVGKMVVYSMVPLPPIFLLVLQQGFGQGYGLGLDG
jgi:hypothetical protein